MKLGLNGEIFIYNILEKKINTDRLFFSKLLLNFIAIKWQ